MKKDEKYNTDFEEANSELASSFRKFESVLRNSSSVDTKLCALITIILSGFDDLKQYIDKRFSGIDPKKEEKPKLIPVDTAAKAFSVCSQTIRNYYGRKQIKRYKVGRRILVDANELEAKIRNSATNKY